MGKGEVRTQLSAQRHRGVIAEWKHNSGWINTEGKINHPQAGKHSGRIYVHKDDLKFPASGVTKGLSVEFVVYSDKRGLGAADVRKAVAEKKRSVDADGPLPAGWSKHWDADNEEFYYWNAATKESRWTHPGVEDEDAEEDLPEGWTKEFDPDRRDFYYWHKATRTAHWELPETAKAAAPTEDATATSDAPEKGAAATDAPVLGQMRLQGVVTAWSGFAGEISPLEELAADLKPMLDKNQDKVYVTWRDLKGGVKLKVGSHVDFLLNMDSTGLAATDVCLHQERVAESATDNAMDELEQQWAEQDGEAAERAAAEQPGYGLAELDGAANDDDSELLPGWSQHWSEEHGCHYYWHAATKQTCWERPAVPVDGDDDKENTTAEAEADEKQSSQQGVARLATPMTPLISRPGRAMTPLTPAGKQLLPSASTGRTGGSVPMPSSRAAAQQHKIPAWQPHAKRARLQ